MTSKKSAATLGTALVAARAQAHDLQDRVGPTVAEARERLGYVRPGETPYIVELPDTSPEAPERPRPAAGDVPWYEELWNSLLGKES